MLAQPSASSAIPTTSRLLRGEGVFLIIQPKIGLFMRAAYGLSDPRASWDRGAAYCITITGGALEPRVLRVRCLPR
jgi:hypothetical protein